VLFLHDVGKLLCSMTEVSRSYRSAVSSHFRPVFLEDNYLISHVYREARRGFPYVSVNHICSHPDSICCGKNCVQR
jgi:hypothetical protein